MSKIRTDTERLDWFSSKPGKIVWELDHLREAIGSAMDAAERTMLDEAKAWFWSHEGRGIELLWCGSAQKWVAIDATKSERSRLAETRETKEAAVLAAYLASKEKR